MLVDMHLHALPNSTDSFLTLEEIVSLAKMRGLDAICLTDHDSMGWYLCQVTGCKLGHLSPGPIGTQQLIVL